jgi:hypothetical protein
MNPDTGAIATFETDEDAKEAGFTVPLSKSQATTCLAMHRQERLGVISADIDTATRFHPLARMAGMSDDDVRKVRNAAKRARRARR